MARALDHVGERWALLIVRELLLGPKRFTDLRAGLPSASQNVLSQRLRELETSDLVRRRRLPAPAASWVYELTEVGKGLEPVVLALARWGSRMPMSSAGELSVDALMMALRSTFTPDGFTGVVELRIGEDAFLAGVSAEGLSLTRGSGGADAVLETTPAELRSLVFEGRAVDPAR
ncbi:MAG: helix-turn-helix transcriptional regulator, partial [Nonomuraea sp.]|nr:helix-turn-helix transcriptional regulator [Nonomuraea sp.]